MTKVEEHILALLKEHGTIRYNENFYRDGDEALFSELCAKFGVKGRDGGPPVMVDDAVWDLTQTGLVEKRELPELMGDGENDYEITLTQKGREFLAAR